MKLKKCENCNKLFPICISINNKQRNLNNRKFCLECSPFGKHNTSNITTKNKATHKCGECKEELTLDYFYKRKNRNNDPSGYCKKCTNKRDKRTRYKTKLKAIDYMGGCCVNCGYCKSYAALEFHHLNSKNKNFSISSKNYGWEKIKKELKDCIMLCANCHQEYHDSLKGDLKTKAGVYFKEAKKKAVLEKGGKCQGCGYNKNIGSLDFHHINPLQKDFSISNIPKISFIMQNMETEWHLVKQELSKCLLVCRNCHREIHRKEL